MTTETTTEPLTVKHLDDDTPSTYKPVANEPNDCNVYIYLDTRDRELSYQIVHPANSRMTPGPVWNSIDQRWGIPPLPRDAANKLLDDLEPIMRRIADGTTVEWDGSNHSGTHTDDAQNAIQEVWDHLERKRQWMQDERERIYRAESYWHTYHNDEIANEVGITAATTDDELEEIAEAEIEVAAGQHEYVIDQPDMYDFLHGVRSAIREEQ